MKIVTFKVHENNIQQINQPRRERVPIRESTRTCKEE